LVSLSFITSATATAALSDGSAVTTTPVYTDLDGLDFAGPVSGGTAGGLGGNESANRFMFASTEGATVNPGEFLVLLWLAPNDTSNDHWLAVDNLVITAVPVPEPTGLQATGSRLSA
jgi:hypothetical protein